MTENTNKSVFINGNKNYFYQGAVQRFKNDLKKCDVKNINLEDGKYLNPGYIFDIKFKDNNFTANIITHEEHMRNEKEKFRQT